MAAWLAADWAALLAADWAALKDGLKVEHWVDMKVAMRAGR